MKHTKFYKSAKALLALAFFMLAGVLLASQRDAAANSFFKGKTITIVVGYGPGGGFDILARLMARHMRRHIEGSPRFIVQNKPGAGGLIAANWVYGKQPGNGLTVAMFHYSFVTQAFMKDPTVTFDPLKYIWFDEPTIGTLPRVVFLRTDLGIHTFEDFKSYKRPLGMAESGRGTGASVATEFLKNLGLPIKNIYGYRGSADGFAAIERGEVDGRLTSQESAQTRYKRFLDDDIIRPVLTMGSDPRIKTFPGVATFKDLKLNAKQKKVAKFLTRTWSRLRMFALPPGTPPDRVKILRTAFTKTLTDKKFLKEAKRQRLIISPAPWQDVVADIKGLADAPPDIVREYRKLLGLKN